MRVVIEVSAEDRARAWGVLVRHSPEKALASGTFLSLEEAARALRRAGINFTEIPREAVAVAPGGVVAGALRTAARSDPHRREGCRERLTHRSHSPRGATGCEAR